MMAPFRRRSLLGLLAATGVLVASSPVRADNPVLRHQEDLHGDVVVLGSTLGYDCGAGVAVPTGATSGLRRPRQRLRYGAGPLLAGQRRQHDHHRGSGAHLGDARYPRGRRRHLRAPLLGALKDGAAPDTTAQLDYLNGPVKTITADKTWVVPYGPAHPTWSYYQASGT